MLGGQLMYRHAFGIFCGAALTAVSGIGCGAPETETEPPTTGTVVLTFSIPEDIRMSDKIVDPLLGNVYGALYYREDVGIAGPHDGVADVTGVEVLQVDLRTVDPSVEAWTSGPLEARDYSFLGMLDVDANSTPENRVPDAGDLVMLGTTNYFEIVAGEETQAVVVFNLVYN
jgi:hypothetical protein